MVGGFLFKSSDHEFLTQSQGRYQTAHSENGKMTESKTEKKKTIWVKKVVEALDDS